MTELTKPAKAFRGGSGAPERHRTPCSGLRRNEDFMGLRLAPAWK